MGKKIFSMKFHEFLIRAHETKPRKGIIDNVRRKSISNLTFPRRATIWFLYVNSRRSRKTKAAKLMWQLTKIPQYPLATIINLSLHFAPTTQFTFVKQKISWDHKSLDDSVLEHFSEVTHVTDNKWDVINLNTQLPLLQSSCFFGTE